jgi:hypothetical protein
MSTYQLSPRVSVGPGDTIRVSAGPYVKLKDGRKMVVAARGLYQVVDILEDKSRTSLVVYSRKAGWSVLHVGGRRRNRSIPGLVCRPYKIKKAKAPAARKPMKATPPTVERSGKPRRARR